MDGWICLYRQLLDWEWYSDKNTTRLFIHCLLRANHSPKKWQGIYINRGQFWTSLDTLSAETGLSVMQIRTSLNRLKSTGEITSSQHARGRMITIVGYDNYQDGNKLNNKLATGSQQARNKLVTTNNNDNNKNNDNNNINNVCVSKDLESAFDIFWNAGMRKVNKQKALSAFKTQSKSKDLFEFANKLANDIRERLRINQFGFESMHPTTYLNGRRWEDEKSKANITPRGVNYVSEDFSEVPEGFNQ